MGVGGGLRDGVHRRGHHIVAGKVGDDFRHGQIGHQFPHGNVDGFPVVGPLVAGSKAGVFEPFRFAQGIADPMPVMLVAGGNQHPAVLAGISAAGRGRRLAPPGLHAGPVIGGNRNFGVAVAGVGQAHINALPLAGSFPLVQGGQSANGGVQGGGAVDNRHAGPNRRTALRPGNHGNARHGLPDGVVANLIPVGAELPIGRDIDHNDPGVQLLQDLVAEPHLFDGAGAEVLEDDIGNLDQFPQGFLALLLPQVHTQRLLAAVILHPIGALFPHPGAVIAGFLAAQPLHLDNFGPQPGQHLGAARPGLMPAQVNDANAAQRTSGFCHLHTPPKVCPKVCRLIYHTNWEKGKRRGGMGFLGEGHSLRLS